MSEHINTELKDQILRIEINRPNKRNALTRDMYQAMADAINNANDDPSVRVILLHGENERYQTL